MEIITNINKLKSFFKIDQERRGRSLQQSCNNDSTEKKDIADVAIIYRSELDFISRCILDYPNIETGGQLFGFWTTLGAPVVLYAIGPGEDSQHQRISFVQDQNYLQKIGRMIHMKYRIQHIGEWHSHHQLGLAHPSDGDEEQMRYAVNVPGFPRMLLCIGNLRDGKTTINPFSFSKSAPYNYTCAQWDVVDEKSPFRSLIDTELKDTILHPLTPHACLLNEKPVKRPEPPTQKKHWLFECRENVETMKAFVSAVSAAMPQSLVKTELTDDDLPMINVGNGQLQIILPSDFPQASPVLKRMGMEEPENNGVAWQTDSMPLQVLFNLWLDSHLTSPSPQSDEYINY